LLDIPEDDYAAFRVLPGRADDTPVNVSTSSMKPRRPEGLSVSRLSLDSVPKSWDSQVSGTSQDSGPKVGNNRKQQQKACASGDVARVIAA
jgi:hypothetical protein